MPVLLSRNVANFPVVIFWVCGEHMVNYRHSPGPDWRCSCSDQLFYDALCSMCVYGKLRDTASVLVRARAHECNRIIGLSTLIKSVSFESYKWVQEHTSIHSTLLSPLCINVHVGGDRTERPYLLL